MFDLDANTYAAWMPLTEELMEDSQIGTFTKLFAKKWAQEWAQEFDRNMMSGIKIPPPYKISKDGMRIIDKKLYPWMQNKKTASLSPAAF